VSVLQATKGLHLELQDLVNITQASLKGMPLPFHSNKHTGSQHPRNRGRHSQTLHPFLFASFSCPRSPHPNRAAFEGYAGTSKQEALSWQLWGNDVDVSSHTTANPTHAHVPDPPTSLPPLTSHHLSLHFNHSANCRTTRKSGICAVYRSAGARD